MKNVPMTMHVTAQGTTDDLMYSRLAQSLARDYVEVYYVNAQTEEFVKYSIQSDGELAVSLWGEKFFDDVRYLFLPRIHPDDRSTFLAAINKENILHVLSVDRSLILNFRIETNQKMLHVEIKATRMVGGDESHIVVGVMNLEDHTRRVAEYERISRDSHTFASILEAMAADYIAIFYVDVLSGDYVEYEPGRSYLREGEGIDKEGTDFFRTRGREILEQLHEEDRHVISRSFSPKILMARLAVSPTLIHMCRLVRDGSSTFVSIKVTRMGDDRHVVIGISDIDDQVRREDAHAKALSAAQAIANRDSLTGVKSKHAFAEAETSLNQMIKTDRSGMKDFAVVVCDVNNLKVVNDTQGHKAGDELIRSACHLISHCFKHSAVYRVGGDEFVAILMDEDYENRMALLQEINEQIEKNQRTGGVVVAIGSSEFRRDLDRGFIPVFDRADAAMYRRKAELKAM